MNRYENYLTIELKGADGSKQKTAFVYIERNVHSIESPIYMAGIYGNFLISRLVGLRAVGKTPESALAALFARTEPWRKIL